MAENSEIMLMLGEIKGELKGITQSLKKVDAIDNRLRNVEIKAARNGAISGSVAGVGIALIVEAGKAVFKHAS